MGNAAFKAAQIAYEEYSRQAGGKSLATGAPLPGWEDLPDAIKYAWEASAYAIMRHLESATWVSVDDKLPMEGEEVTVYMIGGGIRQVVKDKGFGGWKSPNCGGWQQETSAFITHWTRSKFKRPVGGSWWNGPDNAPWHIQGS